MSGKPDFIPALTELNVQDEQNDDKLHRAACCFQSIQVVLMM